MHRAACCLLVILACVVPAVGTATAATAAADGTPVGTPDNTTSTGTATPDRTVMASDGTFGGFTLGAAILAVVVAGSYRYLRG